MAGGFEMLPDLSKGFWPFVFLILAVGGGCGACGMYVYQKDIAPHFSVKVEVQRK
jgi:threonine dehydratase